MYMNGGSDSRRLGKWMRMGNNSSGGGRGGDAVWLVGWMWTAGWRMGGEGKSRPAAASNALQVSCV
jgi:hypothetical protein